MAVVKRKWITVLALAFCLALAGCSGPAEPSEPPESESAPASSAVKEESSSAVSTMETRQLEDSNGTVFSVPDDPRVVSLYASYSEAWLLAGGSLAGVTDDVISERGLDVGNAAVIGTVKEPSAEEIIALNPDLVILSSDITAHGDVKDVLENAGLSCAFYRVDTFEDYAFQMEQFCGVTGRRDLYEKNVTEVKAQIDSVLDRFSHWKEEPRVLLMRAFSTGVKAKTDDELAGAILKELGCRNIADDHPSMLEDLSLEEVILEDPDYIFVTTMGSHKKALEYLDGLIEKNRAWQGLSAVQNGRYIVLPQELFHYKPNDRWGDTYQYLADILWPEGE